jgi:hypothetical protein
MYIFVKILYCAFKPQHWLERKFSKTGGDILLNILYLVLPVAIVLVPCFWFQVIAIIFSTSILLICFSLFTVGTLGSERIKGKKGIIDLLKEEGFKKTLLWFFGACITVILNYGVIYTAIDTLSPCTHFTVQNPTNAIIDFEYFSFVTIITLGYGDILPKSYLAKLICMSEMAFGILIFFVALALVMAGASRNNFPDK